MRRRRHVDVQPAAGVAAMRQMLVDEKAGARRLRVLSVLHRILHVCELGVELVCEQLRHEETWVQILPGQLPGVDGVLLQLLVRRQYQAMVGACGDCLRAGQGRHLYYQITVQVLRDMRYAVSQDEAPLGIGVVNLDGEPAVTRQDVVLDHHAFADVVLRQAKDAMQRLAARKTTRLGDGKESAENAGSASHVSLHADLTFSRLQSSATSVEGDPFAHDRGALLATALSGVCQHQQARRRGRTPPGVPQQPVATLPQGLALDDSVRHATHTLQGCDRDIPEKRRVDDVRGAVHEVLSQTDAVNGKPEPRDHRIARPAADERDVAHGSFDGLLGLSCVWRKAPGRC
mmetsp:Transcript_69649/g.201945  ORF Transcript_69649/g.201945 Transcript_69649/m.201945 type:complete len:345 (+) Transcript_69649:204-1238(+)